MYMDIDNFKFVNDEYSHDVGDQLLRGLCEVIAHNLGPGDMLARISGDEFAAAIADAADPASAQAVVRRVIEAVAAQPFTTSSGPVFSSISAGLSLSRDDVTAELHVGCRSRTSRCSPRRRAGARPTGSSRATSADVPWTGWRLRPA